MCAVAGKKYPDNKNLEGKEQAHGLDEGNPFWEGGK